VDDFCWRSLFGCLDLLTSLLFLQQFLERIFVLIFELLWLEVARLGPPRCVRPVPACPLEFFHREYHRSIRPLCALHTDSAAQSREGPWRTVCLGPWALKIARNATGRRGYGRSDGADCGSARGRRAPPGPAGSYARRCRAELRDARRQEVRIGTRVIISPSDAEPVEVSHPALFVPRSEAIAAAPTRSETLAREADEATKLAQQTKNSAALAVKEAAPLTAALRKLELAKTGADAALAVAEKALAAAKTD